MEFIHNHNLNSSSSLITQVIWIVHAVMCVSKEKSAITPRTTLNYRKSRKLLKKELYLLTSQLVNLCPMLTRNTARFQVAQFARECLDWKKKLIPKLLSTEKSHMHVILSANSASSTQLMLGFCSLYNSTISIW